MQSNQIENTQPAQNDDDNNELSLMDNSFDFESHSDDSLVYYFDENEQRSYFQAIDNDFPWYHEKSYIILLLNWMSWFNNLDI